MNKDLSTLKVFWGATAASFLTAIFWQSGPTCAGICLIFALIFWVMLYLRFATVVRSVRGSLPRRQRFTPVEQQPTRPLTPSTPDDDSRSIFL